MFLLAWANLFPDSTKSFTANNICGGAVPGRLGIATVSSGTTMVITLLNHLLGIIDVRHLNIVKDIIPSEFRRSML
jgi:hypothetical protein